MLRVRFLLFLFLVSSSNAQQPTWTHFAAAGVGPTFDQGSQSTVYDSATDRLIVFGGFDETKPCCVISNDTWVLINASGVAATPTWQKLAVSAPSGLPPGRILDSAVYDPSTNRMIIFGGGQPNGFALNLLGDVWVLKNANGLGGMPEWIPRSPSGGAPAAREGHGAFYKQATNELIVFGGANNGIMSVPNDLWSLQNANSTDTQPTWVPLAQAGDVPGRLEHFASAYNPTSDLWTIALGCCGYTSASRFLALNGPSGTPQWTNLSPGGTAPPGGDAQNFFYDQDTNSLYVQTNGPGGWSSATWLLSGVNTSGAASTWTNVIPKGAPGSPPDATVLIMGSAYNPVSKKFIVALSRIDATGNRVPEVWVLSLTPVLQTGTIQVTTNLSSGTFSIAGPQNFSGNGTSTTFTNAPVGTYTVTFNAVPGYVTPSLPSQLLSSGATLSFSGVYSPIVSGPPAPPSNNGPAQNPTSKQASGGEPVSTGNGNYYYQHTDFAISSRGLPLLFQRSYDTLDNYAGPLGANWTHSYNVILTQTSTGVATIRWGDGHGETFTLTGTTYVPQTGVFSTFVANADTTFTLTRKDRTKYNFSSVGKLTGIQDRNGNTISLTYDSSGNLTSIIDAVGRSLTVSYDSNNRITQITDPIARAVSYSYDANNNLITATDAAGGITQYVYDANHRVTSITLPNGNLLLQNTYDAQGRVTAQKGGRGFSSTFAYDVPLPGQRTIADARGNQTIHTYDSSMRIASVTDALGGVTSYAYDAQNNRTSVTDANGHATAFTYDANANLLSITDALSHQRQFSYDATNDLLSVTTPLGNVTSFSYDSRGNLLSMTDPLSDTAQFAYDGFGDPISRTDQNGNKSTFTYDSNGNLAKTTDPIGNARTMAYDGDGRLVSVTDGKGHTSSITLDNLDRVSKELDPLGNATQFAYDQVGNLLKLTDPNNHATSYAYDSNNDLTDVSDALTHITQYAYDADNNRTAFTNANGNASTYGYDALNRLATSADPLGNTTTYSYDRVGNVTSTTDANGVTNGFTYDAVNRLTGIAYGDGTTVSYTYDTDGRRTSMVDSTGLTTYTYDNDGRLLTVTNPAGQAVLYGYDAAGNRTSLTYPDGKIVSHLYDGENRMSQATDWLGRNTTYTYDSANNVTRIGYPTGAGVSFIYDNANRLTKVSNTTITGTMSSFAYTLDAAGNRVAITSNGLIKKYGYDALNELISQTQGTQITSWTYDSVGNRLQQMTPTGSTIYAYDDADRMTSAGATTYQYDGNGNRLAGKAGLATTTFAYDAANRLRAVVGFGVNSSFLYDGDGNRVAQNTALGNYTYVNDIAAPLPVVVNENGPEGAISFEYGLNLIQEYASGFNYFYQFDGLGSTVGLTDTAGKAATAFAYDPWGNTTNPGSVGLKDKFHFTGEALDPGTGLYYLRARYYDPTVGRFITSDPSPGFSTLPDTLNRYSYAYNSPQTLKDPSGRLPAFLLLPLLDCAQNWVVCGPLINLGINVSQYPVSQFLYYTRELFLEPRVIHIVPAPPDRTTVTTASSGMPPIVPSTAVSIPANMFPPETPSVFGTTIAIASSPSRQQK